MDKGTTLDRSKRLVLKYLQYGGVDQRTAPHRVLAFAYVPSEALPRAAKRGS